MEVLIAGDFCARNGVPKNNENGMFETFSQIRQIINENSLNIVNLEAPFIEEGTIDPIEKTGPALCQNKNVLDAIKYMGFNCVTLANNHFRDYGDKGCRNTLSEIEKNSLFHVGGGNNITDATQILYYSEPSYIPNNNFQSQIAIVNFCETEFSVAGLESGGSAPLDEITNYHQIQEARKNAKYVVVIVHGGIEHYHHPTPRMVKLYRWFIEIGADVVVNHHQHCYCGYESYKNGMIFYGLGNFCFDRLGKVNSDWNQGYILRLQFENDKSLEKSFEIIPYIQCEDSIGIRLMKEEEHNLFNKRIQEYNSVIKNEKDLTELYNNHVKLSWNDYRCLLSPYTNKLLVALCRRKLLPVFISRIKLLSFLNITRCPSHRESFIASLLNKLSE